MENFSNQEQSVEAAPEHLVFSPVTGIRINDSDKVLGNSFVSEAITNSSEDFITYQDGYLILMVENESLAHFLHLAYSYAEEMAVVTATMHSTIETKIIMDDSKEFTSIGQIILLSST